MAAHSTDQTTTSPNRSDFRVAITKQNFLGMIIFLRFLFQPTKRNLDAKMSNLMHFQRSWSVTRALIHRLKYGNHRHLCKSARLPAGREHRLRVQARLLEQLVSISSSHFQESTIWVFSSSSTRLSEPRAGSGGRSAPLPDPHPDVGRAESRAGRRVCCLVSRQPSQRRWVTHTHTHTHTHQIEIVGDVFRTHTHTRTPARNGR